MTGKIGIALRECTNNAAEYHGLILCLQDAVRRGVQDAVFQVDSLLIAKQSSMEWRCRNQSLRVLYEETLSLLQHLESRGGNVSIVHIYREFNVLADSLANEVLNTGTDVCENWSGFIRT